MSGERARPGDLKTKPINLWYQYLDILSLPPEVKEEKFVPHESENSSILLTYWAIPKFFMH